MFGAFAVALVATNAAEPVDVITVADKLTAAGELGRQVKTRIGITAEIAVVEPTGAETMLLCRLGEHEITAVIRERHAFAPGQRIHLRPDATLAHLFNIETGERISQ